jgi:hypothetical protein
VRHRIDGKELAVAVAAVEAEAGHLSSTVTVPSFFLTNTSLAGSFPEDAWIAARQAKNGDKGGAARHGNNGKNSNDAFLKQRPCCDAAGENAGRKC